MRDSFSPVLGWTRIGEFLGRHRLDLGLCALLITFAVLLRLPNLSLIPRFTDETIDMSWAASLARGGWWPLHFNALDYYRGPVFEYIVAGLFRLVGFDPRVPRVATLAFGAGTVGLTYWMGKLMWGRIAGVIAADLLMTSPSHILVNCHVAWASSVTPFFTTLGLILFYHSIQNARRRWLPISAFVFALALQTHPLVMLLVPPLLFWFLARRGIMRWLRSPWPYLSLLSAVAGYGNMIWFNLESGFWSFRQAASRGYAFQIAPDQQAYVGNLNAYVSQLLGLSSNTLGRHPNFVWYLGQVPQGILVWGILFGLVYAAGRGNGFLLITVIGYSILLPYVNHDYSFFQTRYVVPLLPLAFIAFGVAGQDVMNALIPRGQARAQGPRAASAKRRILTYVLATAVGISVAAIMGSSILRLNDFYKRAGEAGYTNASYLSIAQEIARHPNRSAPVFIGDDLRSITWRFGGIADRAVTYSLDVWGLQYRPVATDDLPDIVRRLPTPDALFVITPRSFTSLKQSLPGYRFKELQISPPQQQDVPNRVGLYLLVNRP